MYDAANQLIAAIDPLGYRTSHHYDLAGRQVALQNAVGHLVTTLYDAAAGRRLRAAARCYFQHMAKTNEPCATRPRD